MKIKLLTKLLCLLLCLCMLAPMLIACGGDEFEFIYEPYDYSDDSRFALTSAVVMSMVKDKVLDIAKEKSGEYLGNIGSKIMVKAANWLKSKLFYCLEIEQTPETPEYTSADIYNKLTSIESDIKDMKNTLDILKNQTSDNQYYIKYTAFVNNLSEIKILTETPFYSLETLNGMSGDNVSEYTALADSIEISLRGSGSYAIPIEQQTEISKKVLAYGNAILGDETSSSLLNTYGIFNIMRHFAERETPWAHQRKEIEDTYLSSIIYFYRNAHALVAFDYAYQMNALGVEELYFAPDGTVIAFKYSPDGTNAKWYYNAYPYQESTLTAKYSQTLSALSESPVSITDIDPAVYSQLVFLFGYYGQHQSQYNRVLLALNSFTRAENETHFVLETQNGKQYKKDIFAGSSRPTGTPESFISWDSGSKDYTIDFDKFKNCKKSEFLDFIEHIKPYAGNKSLYDYLRFVGFNVPKVDGVIGIALGMERKADDVYDNAIQSNSRYPNNFTVYWVNLSTEVKSISSGSISKTWYYAYVWMSGSCNNKPRWSDDWHMSERNPTYGSNERYSTPDYFISINGISNSSRSGKQARIKLDTSW
ncbi:MAG: hypothetical protein IJY01_07855 [Clostridia bacterium]|nr:hypothetical protein [Clostridia bacterium]